MEIVKRQHMRIVYYEMFFKYYQHRVTLKHKVNKIYKNNSWTVFSSVKKDYRVLKFKICQIPQNLDY